MKPCYSHQLDPNELEELDRVVSEFEASWERGTPASIEELLPSNPQLRTALVVELVHVDLERRLAEGEPIRVETYLSQYPVLSANAEIVASLCKSEFSVRCSIEPMLQTEEYCRRFPESTEFLRDTITKSTSVQAEVGPGEGQRVRQFDGPPFGCGRHTLESNPTSI